MNFKELRDNFRAKRISAKEAVKDSLAKIKDDKLNIFINYFEKEALTMLSILIITLKILKISHYLVSR